MSLKLGKQKGPEKKHKFDQSQITFYSFDIKHQEVGQKHYPKLNVMRDKKDKPLEDTGK